jgi:hypothetical protein
MILLSSDWIPEFPLETDPFAFGIPIDALLITTELRIISRQQNQTSKNPSAKLIEKIGVAVIAVDLPMRRNRTEVHNSSMAAGRLNDG